MAVIAQMILDVDRGNEVLEAILPGYLRNFAIFHGTIALLGPLWAVLRLRGIALTEQSEPAKRRNGCCVSGRGFAWGGTR